jgi:hypothetical protein
LIFSFILYLSFFECSLIDKEPAKSDESKNSCDDVVPVQSLQQQEQDPPPQSTVSDNNNGTGKKSRKSSGSGKIMTSPQPAPSSLASFSPSKMSTTDLRLNNDKNKSNNNNSSHNYQRHIPLHENNTANNLASPVSVHSKPSPTKKRKRISTGDDSPQSIPE